MDRVIHLIKQDKLRLKALDCVYHLELPQCYIAAGFVRNVVWDHLHKFTNSSQLNDVDVIYFNPTEKKPEMFKYYELQLHQCIPQLNWQVRNQALMHFRNNDKPYENALDAMSYWPEKETAIAIRKNNFGHLEGVSAFGLDSLFNLEITYNSKRLKSVFEERVKTKKWLEKWSNLTIIA